MLSLARARGTALALSSVSVVACITSVSDVPSHVLTNPSDPTQTIATTPSTEATCGTICDALISDYGVPLNLKDACVFECVGGFAQVPDACYELVACVAKHTLCEGADISPTCAEKAGDCFALWSLANGSCRGCWQPSRTVHGKQIVTYLSEGTPPADPRPEDFSNDTIAALLPSASAEPYRFPGTGNADGTYSIPNVPGCGVWIQVGTTYTWAGNNDVDTSYNFPGRRNGVIAGPMTTYEVDVQNLVGWTQEDWLEIFTPQLGNSASSFLGIDPSVVGAIDSGSTSYHWSIDLNGGALADALQHDVLYVAQLPTQTLPNGTLVRTVDRAARLADFSPKNGVMNPLVVNLEPVPPSRQVHLDYRLSSFLQFSADFNPAGKLGTDINPMPGSPPATTGMVDIWTHPGRPRVGATAELALVEHPGSTEDIPPLDVSFGTPYGADWGIDLATSTLWTVPLKDRHQKDFFAFEGINTMVPLDKQGSEPLTARIGPPRNIRINGQSAWTAQDGQTLTPRFEWDPPALGTPTKYEVVVWQLGLKPNPRGSVAANLEIPTLPGANEPAIRSFVLPTGILTAGNDYYFTIAAMDTANERMDDGTVVTSEYRP
jgi:hypothetical protein